MDGYSYTNIFETKGIEYLVIIGFLLLLIPFWIVLNKKIKISKHIHRVLGHISSKILKIPQGIYFCNNHTWVHLHESGNAKIGLDDLLLHLTGEITYSNLLKQGTIINKGDLLVEVLQKGKQLKIFSPLSGKILHSNELLNENPGISNEDPYGKGWIYRIKPTNWKSDTNSYYLADEATIWSSNELERFKDFLADTIKRYSTDKSNIILQDGGELCDNLLSELPKEIWLDFQSEFLNLTATKKNI
jgi:glycine cleavage system H protein